jgi:hypothetical protein
MDYQTAPRQAFFASSLFDVGKDGWHIDHHHHIWYEKTVVNSIFTLSEVDSIISGRALSFLPGVTAAIGHTVLRHVEGSSVRYGRRNRPPGFQRWGWIFTDSTDSIDQQPSPPGPFGAGPEAATGLIVSKAEREGKWSMSKTKTKTAATKKPAHPLVGAGLHWRDEKGRIENQACIIAVIPSGSSTTGDLALIQYFEFFSGSPSTRRLIQLSELASTDRWVFYSSVEEMRDYYQHVEGGNRESDVDEPGIPF